MVLVQEDALRLRCPQHSSGTSTSTSIGRDRLRVQAAALRGGRRFGLRRPRLRRDGRQAARGPLDRALPSILRCDRPNLVSATAGDVRERLRDLLKSGATIVAHTPQSDLRALGFDEAEYSEVLPSGVVDVARLRLPNDGEYHEVASLRRMAKAHLKLERFQRGGARHCAIQDALVTLRIYQALTDEESEGERY